MVRFAEGKVSLVYQDNKGKWHKEALAVEKFMSLFLQHVLPKRFMKVRYYGFLSPRKRQMLDVIKELFNSSNDRNTESGEFFAEPIVVGGRKQGVRC